MGYRFVRSGKRATSSSISSVAEDPTEIQGRRRAVPGGHIRVIFLPVAVCRAVDQHIPVLHVVCNDAASAPVYRSSPRALRNNSEYSLRASA